MKLYSGFDLHANNTYTGIKDESGKSLINRKVDNEPIYFSGEKYRCLQEIALIITSITTLPSAFEALPEMMSLFFFLL